VELNDFTAKLRCDEYSSELRAWAKDLDRTVTWHLLTLAPHLPELGEVHCKEYLHLVADALAALAPPDLVIIPEAARSTLLAVADNGIRSLIEAKTSTRLAS
jgi:hypothetical protein